MLHRGSCRPLLVFCLPVVLAGCSGFSALEEPGGSRYENPNEGRYSLQNDRGPSRQLDESDIGDLEVVHEPQSRSGNNDYTLFGKRYEIMDSAVGYRETGLASWYGEKFHGHTTSNGETYDMYQLSAAHTRLPLPTYVRVTNLENRRSTIVRVNDRGPFHDERIIDLSYAAAVKLGFAAQGVARVRIEALTPESDLQQAVYWLQFGAFSDHESAQRVQAQVRAQLGERAEVQSSDLHRVRLGPLTEKRVRALRDDWIRRGNDEPIVLRP